MKRSTLSPEFEPMLQRLLERVDGRAQFLSPLNYRRSDDHLAFSAIVAEHAPDHVSQVESQMRKVVDQHVGKMLKPPYPVKDHEARRMVRGLCASCPDVALPLTTAWSGYIREEALKHACAISSPFDLALALRRLNDWVPQVRIAAANCIRRNILKDASPDRSRYIVACIGNILDARKFGRSCSESEPILHSLIDYPNVISQWKDQILNAREDAAPRGLRLALQAGYFLNDLELFSSKGAHRGVRRIAARALLDGVFVWREGRRLAKREIPQESNRDVIATTALGDPSVEVLHLGIQYVGNAPDSTLRTEECLRPFLQHPNKAVSLTAAFGVQRLGVNLSEELTNTLEMTSPAPFWAARLLSHINKGRGGELIYRSYKKLQTGPNIEWLELSARLNYIPAINELTELALSSSNLALSRRASKALVRTGHNIEFAPLQRAANAGELENRGLQRFFSSLTAIEMVRIIAALQRSGAHYPDEALWSQVQNKRMKCAFLPTRADLAALEADIKGIPHVAQRADSVLGLSQTSLIVAD